MAGRTFATGEFDGDLATLSALREGSPRIAAAGAVAFPGGAAGPEVWRSATSMANLGWVDAFTSPPCRFTGPRD